MVFLSGLGVPVGLSVLGARARSTICALDAVVVLVTLVLSVITVVRSLTVLSLLVLLVLRAIMKSASDPWS